MGAIGINSDKRDKPGHEGGSGSPACQSIPKKKNSKGGALGRKCRVRMAVLPCRQVKKKKSGDPHSRRWPARGAVLLTSPGLSSLAAQLIVRAVVKKWRGSRTRND